MKVDNFLKKHKIKKIYSYFEEREKNAVKFGWIPSKSLDLNNPVVITSISKSKKVLDTDKEWSKREGNNVASLKDYNRYFEALTGDAPDSFISKWGTKVAALEDSRREENPNYRDSEGEFLLDMAILLSKGKRFTKFGRVFKIITVNT